MIPPHFYFPPNPDEITKKYEKYKNKVPKAPKHERKLAAIERKKARLNPDQPSAVDRIGMDMDIDNDAYEDDDDDGNGDGNGDGNVAEEEKDEAEEMPNKQAKRGSKPEPAAKEKRKEGSLVDSDGDDGDGISDDDDGFDEDDGHDDDDDEFERDSARPPRRERVRPLRPEPSLDKCGRFEGLGREEQAVGSDTLKQRMAEKLAHMRGERGGKEKGPGERKAASGDDSRTQTLIQRKPRRRIERERRSPEAKGQRNRGMGRSGNRACATPPERVVVTRSSAHTRGYANASNPDGAGRPAAALSRSSC